MTESIEEKIKVETTGKIASALAKAQVEFKPVRFNKEGKVRGTTKSGQPYEYSYKYADLSAIIEATRPALSKYGLAVSQLIQNVGAGVGVTTRLLHESGESLECTFSGTPDKPGPQAMGSIITYFRRYGRAAILDIAAEEDDDAAGAESSGGHGKETLPSPPRGPAPQAPRPPANVSNATLTMPTPPRPEPKPAEPKPEPIINSQKGRPAITWEWLKERITSVRDLETADRFYTQNQKHADRFGKAIEFRRLWEFRKEEIIKASAPAKVDNPALAIAEPGRNEIVKELGQYLEGDMCLVDLFVEADGHMPYLADNKIPTEALKAKLAQLKEGKK